MGLVPATNDIVQARYVGLNDAEPVINTFTFALTTGFGTWTELTDLLNSEIEGSLGMSGNLTTGHSVQYRLTALQVVDVYPHESPMHSYTLNQAGDITDEDALPPNDCLCVTFRSDYKGPGGRGRAYLTGYAESAQNAGYWESAIQENADGVFSSMYGQFGEEGDSAAFRWIIAHRSNHGAKLDPPEIKPVMSWTVHNEVRSLGRRAVGRRIPRPRA